MNDPKPRAFLPDEVKDDAMFLIKACSRLLLTYEVRLAAFMAQQSNRRLEIVMTCDCQMSPALVEFAGKYGVGIRKHKA